jgi:Family of unknown function (DUF5677)
LEILNFSLINSKLKPYFNDFVVTHLDSFYYSSILEITPENEIQQRALVLFVKSVNCIKSINTLFNNGDIVSARILMRSLFELVLLIKKIRKEPEEFIRYSKAYEKFKSMEMNKVQLSDMSGEGFIQFLSKEELENNIESLKQEITDLGFTPTWNKQTGKPVVEKYFEIKELAIEVDMENLYKTTYKNLCLDTHTSSAHFNKYYFVTNSGSEILNLHPYLHELDLMICITVGFMFDFFSDFNALLNTKEKTTAEIQYNKLSHFASSLMPRLTLQGHFKKNGLALML